MDRRIMKTRKAIMTSFVELLMEKDFEKITINEIAERADINRGTLYLHYIDKFDVMDQCVDAHITQLLTYCEGSAENRLSENAIKKVFEYLEQNYMIYKVLLKNEHVGFFRNRLYETFSQMGMKVTHNRHDNSSVSDDVTNQFLTSGFIGIIEWWIECNMPCTVDEITKQVIDLLTPYTKFLQVTH